MKVLSPVVERPADYDPIFRMILDLFRDEIYGPIMKLIGSKAGPIQNAAYSDLELLARTIQRGIIRFDRGRFRGRFSAKTSRALRSIGAQWLAKEQAYKLSRGSLPPEVLHAISISDARFAEVATRVDGLLGSIRPDKISEKLQLQKFFDRTLFKVEGRIQDTLKGLSVAPVLNVEERKRLADEYTKNMQLYIQDFTEKETLELRKRILMTIGNGGRYEALVDEIKRSYGVSHNKAKFLARQETSLMVTKFKQIRYQAAGSDEYIWTCVAGSKDHPVRPLHKALDGKRVRWDTGAVCTPNGERKNAGQDYGCRCYARPIINLNQENA